MRAFLLLILVLLSVVFLPSWAEADDAIEARRLVDLSAITLEKFLRDRKDDTFRRLLADSEAIFICPQLLKGAFVFGLSGGSGVFLVWDEKERGYSGPAFYTLGGISVGLQAGGSSSEVILLFMTKRGVSAMLTSSVKLGIDVGIAFGPKGGGARAETANLSADVIAYYTSKGLFGGLSLDGGIIKVRNDLNKGYYGRDVTPMDILIGKTVRKEEAKRFTKIIREYKKSE